MAYVLTTRGLRQRWDLLNYLNGDRSKINSLMELYKETKINIHKGMKQNSLLVVSI